MFDLCRWQRLGERISDHVFCGAIHEAKGAPLNHPTASECARRCAGASMVLVVLRERDGGLVVGEEGGGLRDGP
jgi:hypothetical protein